MYFYELIKGLSKDKKLIIYVDMDGVIAAYELGKPLDFASKRPLKTNINTLEKISNLENVTLHILSICRKDSQKKEKNDWLDKYAPFFDKDKRVIISKESNPNFSSRELKANYLNSLKKEEQLVLIDDDNGVLDEVEKKVKNIILFQDSELID